MPIDPAESGYLRFFYLDWRPTPLGRVWSRIYAWLAGIGATPAHLVTLQVVNRHNGRLTPTVLVAVSFQGHSYLVSMLGNGSEWVRNVRAAKGRAFLKRGRARPVLLAEIPAAARAPILKAWCQLASSGRNHLPISPGAPLSDFAAIAADYPVFRIAQPDAQQGIRLC